MEKGFAVIKRDWKPGDVVELNIPMPVRFVDCIPEVSENIGKTAVTRGPLVYCAEEVDNAGPVQRLYLGDMNEAQAKVANISSGVLQGLGEDYFARNGKEGRRNHFTRDYDDSLLCLV